MPRRRRGRKREEEPGYVEPLVDEEAASAISRTPGPSDLAAEAAVLGAMLVEREAIRRATSLLTEQDFDAPQHALLFAAIQELAQGDTPVDLVTLPNLLGSRLEEVGGVKYLLSLSDAAPTAAAVRHYARMVREKAQLRRVRLSALSYLTRPDGDHAAALVEALERSVSQGLQLTDAAALRAEEIKVEWLIQWMIPIGGVTVLAGDWFMGKSWLALSLCHALVNGGGQWLGHFSLQRRGAALYVDNEAGPAVMRDRLLELDAGSGRQTPNGEVDPWTVEVPPEREEHPLLFAFYPDPDDLQAGPRVGALEAFIREYGIRLVVLDSLMTLMPPTWNINNNSDVMRALRPARRLAVRTNSAIVVVHHMKKFQELGDNAPGARVLGGTMVMGEPDAALAITGTQQGPKTVVPLKARGAKHPERAFLLGFSSGEDGTGTLLVHDGYAPEPSTQERERAMDTIINLLAGGPQPRQNVLDVAVTVGEVSRRTAERALSDLAREGEVERRRHGRETEFRLVEKAEA